MISFASAALGLDTDLKLKSSQSPRCSVAELQTFLQAGARELVHDVDAKAVVCGWMRQAGIDATKCEAARPPAIAVPTTCVENSDPRWRRYLASEIDRLNAATK